MLHTNHAIPPTTVDSSSSTNLLTTDNNKMQIEEENNKQTTSGTFNRVNEKPIPEGYQSITEGTATIIYSKDTEAFYNKVQVFNRDISTLIIKMYNEQLKEELKENYKNINILEALSATGLRAIRYFKEIPNINTIIANDLLPDPVECIKRNVEFNEISSEKIIANQADAIKYMAQVNNYFDVVDLDPYGTVSPFMDSAMQAVNGNGGLLCVTCTDMAVLCAQQQGACFSKYGIYPQKIKACHEQALRILLGFIQMSASKYKRYIQPLISLSVDFYVRVFVRVHTSNEKVKNSYKSFGNVHICTGCESYHIEPLGSTNHTTFNKENCSECGWRLKQSGPIWIGPLHDNEFLTKCFNHVKENNHLFSTHKRMTGLIHACMNELPDIPLYYILDYLSSVLKCQNPSIDLFKSALLNLGYRVSNTHVKPNAFKTNAPPNVIFDIYKEWIKNHPVKDRSNNSVKTPGQVILEKPQKLENISFELHKDALTGKKYTGIATYLPNPEENWGPGKRKTIHKKKSEQSSTNDTTINTDENVENIVSNEVEEKETKKQKIENLEN